MKHLMWTSHSPDFFYFALKTFEAATGGVP